MAGYYDDTEYNKYIDARNKMLAEANFFVQAFAQYKYFKDVKLSTINFCGCCDNTNVYLRGTAIETDYKNKDRCVCCMDRMNFDAACMDKLTHYEHEESEVQ